MPKVPLMGALNWVGKFYDDQALQFIIRQLPDKFCVTGIYITLLLEMFGKEVRFLLTWIVCIPGKRLIQKDWFRLFKPWRKNLL